MKLTVSLCPTCYKEIPAIITVGEQVTMEKYCSEHGPFTSLVERDPGYYLYCEEKGHTSIYNGYFIDVTKRCNLSCKYCYYAKDSGSIDPSIEYIMQDAIVNAGRAPFILTGGEPTLRDDLPELIGRLQDVGPVELLTNGVRLADDPEYLERLIPLLVEGDTNILRINLSLHEESNGKDLALLDLLRDRGYVVESVLVVIDQVEQIDDILTILNEYRDVICCTRIKAATQLWAEKQSAGIFVSDMMRHLEQKGAVEFWPGRNIKTSFATVLFDGLILMLVSWYSVDNVDLIDIDGAPYYRAQNGQIANIVTAAIINEGMASKNG